MVKSNFATKPHSSWLSPILQSKHITPMLVKCLKHVPFCMFQIGTGQTLSYQSRLSSSRSWSIKNLCTETKSKTKLLHLFICLFFSYECIGLLQMHLVKKTYCCLPSIWQSLHDANLKHVSEWYIFQNGTQCQSGTCFRLASCKLCHMEGRRQYVFLTKCIWSSPIHS